MELKQGALNAGGAGNSDALDKLIASSGAASTTLAPTEGQTITAPPSEKVINLLDLVPSTDLDSVVINLPSESQSKLGQRFFVRSSRQIASVTFQCEGGTVDNWLVMLSAGDCVDFTKSRANTWSRGV
jgi:hypothetical protein